MPLAVSWTVPSPAAGVEAHVLPGLRKGTGQVLRPAGPVRHQTGHVQPVGGGQPVRQSAEAGGPVPLPGPGVDQKDVLHGLEPPSIEWRVESEE